MTISFPQISDVRALIGDTNANAQPTPPQQTAATETTDDNIQLVQASTSQPEGGSSACVIL